MQHMLSMLASTCVVGLVGAAEMLASLPICMRGVKRCLLTEEAAQPQSLPCHLSGRMTRVNRSGAAAACFEKAYKPSRHYFKHRCPSYCSMGLQGCSTVLLSSADRTPEMSTFQHVLNGNIYTPVQCPGQPKPRLPLYPGLPAPPPSRPFHRPQQTETESPTKQKQRLPISETGSPSVDNQAGMYDIIRCKVIPRRLLLHQGT